MVSKVPRPPVLAEIGDRVKNRPSRQRHDRLDDDDRLLILWGSSRGWTNKKIAMALPASNGKKLQGQGLRRSGVGVQPACAGGDRTQSPSMPPVRREPGVKGESDAACARPHPARGDSQRGPTE